MKTFLEKTALSRKNKSFIFPIFVQKGSTTKLEYQSGTLEQILATFFF
jgi:hypothetical protein